MNEFKGTPGPWVVDRTVALGAYGVWTEAATHPGYDGAGYPSPICRMPMREGERKLVTGSKEARDANARVIAAAPDLLDLAIGRHWLVWSNEHRAWWGPNQEGYCWDVTAAGRYSLEEAQEICAARGVRRGDGINPPELLQPSPEWLAARTAAIAKARGAA